MYDNIKRLDLSGITQQPVIIHHYVNGAYLEVRAEPNREFVAEFTKDGSVIYRSNLKGNMWARLNKTYFIDSTCKLYENGKVIFERSYNAKGRDVLITLDSNSLGDSLAWIPYVEEFRKKHDCNVYLSTFINPLFQDQYPEIKFIQPGTRIGNLYAVYHLGWYYKEDGTFDQDRNPVEFKNQPMQKCASDILGLDFKELKPKIKIPDVTKKKKVGLGIHSTAQSKYWNNPTGWQEVVDYLNGQDYQVVIYSKEGDGYMGNRYPTGAEVFPTGPLNVLIEDMASCEFFIGIGSGLSWLAWSLNIPVVLISGFSDTYTEPSQGITRVINKSVCNSCFNRSKLDPSDWNWCPDQKGTPRMFECSKSITGEMVINAIKSMSI